MAIHQILNPDFLTKAEACKPPLIHTRVDARSIGKIYRYKGDWKYKKQEEIGALASKVLKKGDSVCLDFGDHCVGYVSFTVTPHGYHPDAPTHLRLKFGEHPCEIGEKSESYRGGLSSGWIQEEFLHIDVLPCEIKLPRRYAFRYLEILVKDTSPNFQISVENVSCDSVSSADITKTSPYLTDDAELAAIDRISLKTLQDCMQDVFEDGPKRDRRLWIGDLRLQALVNYETVKNYDLVRRCLYLFAGAVQENGCVGSCLYTTPKIEVDFIAFLDYSLFFISCLHDYYEATGDRKIVAELWETAFHQLELVSGFLSEKDIFEETPGRDFFLDWKDGLDKQAGGQAVVIYTAKQSLVLAELLGDTARIAWIKALLDRLVKGAKEHLWDSEQGFFVSGKDRQISWISQVWFVLADIFTKEENRALMQRLIETDPPMGMATPYAYHHFIDALIRCDMKDEALLYIRYYWGSMAKAGADCFFEIWNPKNPTFSPYGSRIINSFCHAWSGTASYFLRKYF